MTKKICILFFWCAVFFGISEKLFAQDKASARYKAGKMIEISDLLSGEETEDCAQKRYVGSITTIQSKAGGKIESFTVKTAKGAVKIYLSPSLYSERLNTKDAKNLTTLIMKGKTVTVDAYVCGASGRTILAMYILAGREPNTLGKMTKVISPAQISK